MKDPNGTESYGFGYRHVMTVLVMLMGFTVSFVQVSVSVGVVSMTSKNSSNQDFESFDWDSVGKNAILSSYFWGLLLGSLAAAQLSQMINVKYLVVFSFSMVSVIASSVPTLAHAGGWQFVSSAVAVQGFMIGIIVPCSYAFMSKWAPVRESSLLLSLANMGPLLGMALGLPMMGYLAKEQFGWPSIYYTTTLFGFVWCTVFFIFASPSPTDNRFVAESEKEYICADQKGSISQKAHLPTPWSKIITSRAVLILVIGEMAKGFGSSVILSELPSYVNDVLQLPIELNGLVSALPSVCLVVVLTPSAWVADYFVRTDKCSSSFIKKFYTFIGLCGNGGLLIAVGLSGKNPVVALTLICLATACATLTISGLHTTHLSIAPNFASVLLGLTNFGAHISGVIAPLTVGQIVKHNTAEEWTWVFVETGLVLITGGAVFVLFGSTELQSWNSAGENERNEISVSA